VVEIVAGRHDSDVVGRQPDVGVGAAVVLLDVGLEVVREATDRRRGANAGKAVIAMPSLLSPT
jgi:hypothetical protein